MIRSVAVETAGCRNTLLREKDAVGGWGFGVEGGEKDQGDKMRKEGESECVCSSVCVMCAHI